MVLKRLRASVCKKADLAGVVTLEWKYLGREATKKLTLVAVAAIDRLDFWAIVRLRWLLQVKIKKLRQLYLFSSPSSLKLKLLKVLSVDLGETPGTTWAWLKERTCAVLGGASMGLLSAMVGVSGSEVCFFKLVDF